MDNISVPKPKSAPSPFSHCVNKLSMSNFTVTVRACPCSMFPALCGASTTHRTCFALLPGFLADDGRDDEATHRANFDTHHGGSDISSAAHQLCFMLACLPAVRCVCCNMACCQNSKPVRSGDCAWRGDPVDPACALPAKLVSGRDRLRCPLAASLFSYLCVRPPAVLIAGCESASLVGPRGETTYRTVVPSGGAISASQALLGRFCCPSELCSTTHTYTAFSCIATLPDHRSSHRGGAGTDMAPWGTGMGAAQLAQLRR